MDEQDRKLTAYHEAGHALVMIRLEYSEPLHKVTIVPRGTYLGATFSLPEKDRFSMSKRHLLADIAGIMGGRIAEDVIFGDCTSGASNDIKQATYLARRMVTEWGMSDRIGMVNVSNHDEHMFLGRDLFRGRDVSEETAREIDEEVRRIIDECYARAKQLILEERAKLVALAEALLEYETLDAAEIDEVLREGKLLNPPKPRAGIGVGTDSQAVEEVINPTATEAATTPAKFGSEPALS
jgi:cell division protease FtsH